LAFIEIKEASPINLRGRPGDGEGFYVALANDPANRSEIDQEFRRLLQLINAKNIAET